MSTVGPGDPVEGVGRVADYTVLRLLGEAGHGRLFLASPPTRLGLPGDAVAVKQVRGTTTDDEYSRVVEELARVAAIGSPHLFTVYEVGRQGPTLFYSMEYVVLGSLAAPSRRLTRAEVIRAMADAARGAHALHEAGITHRDIKPSNVMLHEAPGPAGPGLSGKLADLGLIHLMNPGQTWSGQGPLQSLEFMDPAIVRGDPASRASDIWSLAATLHRVLTGASLYGDIPTGSTIQALRHVSTTQPQLHPSLTAGEAEVVSRCLAAEPGARLHTAEEMALQLDRLVG